MIKLSKTSKLDGIKSWSLEAVETCPGSADGKGGLVDSCKGCYATTGMYVMGHVKAPRAFNKKDWQRADWVNDMVQALSKETHFRWFDSGDLYSLELAQKVLAVMRATPHVKHWLPTRMAKFAKFQKVLAAMRALPNVVVRFSADSIDGTYTPGVHGSVIFPKGTNAPAGVTACGAYTRGGKCGGCRACWDKDVAVIGYPSHGKKMQKVIRLAVATV